MNKLELMNDPCCPHRGELLEKIQVLPVRDFFKKKSEYLIEFRLNEGYIASKFAKRKAMKKSTIAIIIPVLNEKDRIFYTLKHLDTQGVNEIIVVDGGSKDGTYEMIQSLFPNIRCFQTAFAERAFQMNLGAFEAKSDVFIFLHADTQLPANAIKLVREKIQAGFNAGGFCKEYYPSHPLLNLYLKLLNNVYFEKLHRLVGTNAIFVKRAVFEQLQGFPEVPLLEDVMFSDALRKLDGIATIKEPVVVSSRKYYKRGPVKQILRNMRVMLGYRVFHESPTRLREIYQKH